MDDDPKEKDPLTGPDDSETVEVINVKIEPDSAKKAKDKSSDIKAAETAKELFSDFKPDEDFSSESDFENDRNGIKEGFSDDEFDDEPLSKRVKKSTKKEKIVEEGGSGSPKKKHYLQKYKKEWEEIPSVKPWISESIHGNCYFFCKFCKKDYKCGKSEVLKHMSSNKHKKNCIIPISTKTLSTQALKQVFKFRGLLCPVVTPFLKTRARDINYDLLKPYSQFLKACGIKGILVNDVMGEGMSLTLDERKGLVERWGGICAENNQFLMVQIGGAPLKNVVDMAMHAEKMKAGAVVLLPDLYHRPRSHLDLIRYIKIVSNHTGTMPILYHHYPKYTNLDLDVKAFLLDITGEVDTFVGLIISTSDLHENVVALNLNPEKFAVFMGTDEGMLGAVASGFTCIMGNSINILPKLAESICYCIKTGGIKSAQTSQNLLNKTLVNIYNYGEMVPALKAAMSIITKMPIEAVRDPLQTVWEGTIVKMKDKLHEIGII